MTPYEIVLLIAGCAFLVLSFFFGKNSNESPENEKSIENIEIDSDAILKKISDELDARSEDIVEEARLQMERISNEKIMALNEFSEQTLERISHNHEEVLFMYNMLQKKEEELKQTVYEIGEISRKIEALKQMSVAKTTGEFKQIETAAEKTATYQNVSAPSVKNMTALELLTQKKAEAEKRVQKEQQRPVAPVSTEIKKAPVKKVQTVPKQEKIMPPSGDKFVKDTTDEGNKNAEILKLYRQKKSIVEISKILGLGQGEVKLVVDLYGRK